MQHDSPLSYLFYFTSVTVILFFVISLPEGVNTAHNDALDDDESSINVRSYASLQINPEIENNCDLRVMRAYSMYGDAASLSEPNLIYPAITQNCCGPKDQENIKALWRKASNQIVKNQKFFLYLAKGILSPIQDFLRLASHAHVIYDRIHNKKFSLESVKKDYPGLTFYMGDLVLHKRNYKILINADFIKMSEKVKNGIDATKLKIMYHGFNQAAEFMMNVRRSFYGMICSLDGQNACSRKGFLERAFYFDDTYYGTPFCEAMIAHHFRYFYDYYYFFKRVEYFVDRLPFFVQLTEPLDESAAQQANLLQGQAQGVPQRAPTPQTNTTGGTGGAGADFIRKGITIPYGHFLYGTPAHTYFEDNYDKPELNIIDHVGIQACSEFSNFTACEFYCQEFSMVKHNDFFDGSPEHLIDTFRTVMAIRETFEGFYENEFEVDYVTLEKMIDELKRKYNPFIYPSSMPTDIELNEQGNDFSELAGYNPLEWSVGCTLDLTFKYSSIIQSISVFAISWLFFKLE
jgi:hypothetical protein